MVLVNLYTITDDNRVVDKTLTPLYSVTAALITPSSVMTPQLRIAWSSSLVRANYIYIQDFDRYYYITDITADTGGAAIITCRVDVLMTHANAIKLCPAIVTRSARLNQHGSARGSWIRDSKLPIETGRAVRVVEFVGTDINIDVATMTSNNFVLNVAGGGAISGN